MSLVAIGLSHHTSALAVRERLAFAANEAPDALVRLHTRLGGGVVLLSTCNRVEIYASHEASLREVEEGICAFLCEYHQVPTPAFRDSLYVHDDEQAVGHLFRVASSLDSLVVGEAQILGQVRDAYLMAQAKQTTDKILHALFQKAFSVAKNVRTQTHIGAGKVSVSSVAVELAASIFGDFAGKTVLIVGSGEMADLTLKSLVERGVRSVLVVNRNRERAQALVAQYNGEAIPFDRLKEHLHRADIVISTTAAPIPVLHAPEFQESLRKRSYAPMLVIDIAVPRDVDAEVGELDNVYLYNIDNLEAIASENIEMRRKEIELGLELVETGVRQFMQWMHGLAAEPTIASMSEEMDLIRERELQKTLAALPELSDKEREEVAYLTRRIVNNILQRPMNGIKKEIGHHDPHAVLHLAKRLFGLKDTTENEPTF
jgi:glutamyl-tRNA reductase